MRYYCVIQNCDPSQITDHRSFRAALPQEIEFYNTAADAIKEARIIALQSNLQQSFIVVMDLNQPLKKQALATMDGPIFSQTLMPEDAVDYWHIERLSIDGRQNKWKLEKIKQTQNPKNSRFEFFNKIAKTISMPSQYPIRAAIFAGLGVLTLGTVFTFSMFAKLATSLLAGAITYVANIELQKRARVQKTKIESNDQAPSPAYQDGILASRTWAHYFNSYKKRENWTDYLSFRAGMETGYQTAENSNRPQP